MIRKLLATTAIATVVATGAAMAQSATPPATTPAPAATEAPASETAVARAEGELASNVIGEAVYNGTADDAENIGNVNDLVLGTDGRIQSVVVGVGGFLGIGEKNVAIDYNELDMVEMDGDRRITVATTADALKALPAFDRRAYEPEASAGAGTATNTTAPATTDTAANAPAATGGAMAPAATTAPAGDTAAGDATTTDNTTTAAVDRSQLTEVPPAELTAENLEGTTVYGAEDANVGDIGDVVLTADGKVDAIIIDVGGFLGIGEKPVAVGMDNLAFMQDGEGNRYLYTNFTKEQLEAQPEYSEENWAAQRDQMRLTTTQ